MYSGAMSSSEQEDILLGAKGKRMVGELRMIGGKHPPPTRLSIYSSPGDSDLVQEVGKDNEEG